MGAQRLVVALASAALAAALAIGGCGSAHPSGSPGSGVGQTSAEAAIPARLAAEARPIGRGADFHPPALGPVIGPCRAALGPRFGVHVELFAVDRVVLVPAAIGAVGPLRHSEGRISGARCFGALTTLEPTGVVLLRPGSRLTVADLFRSWGQPLTIRRLAGFRAPGTSHVHAFVGGRARHGSPGSIPLTRHAEIVLEVGAHVPPHSSYRFAPGS